MIFINRYLTYSEHSNLLLCIVTKMVSKYNHTALLNTELNAHMPLETIL